MNVYRHDDLKFPGNHYHVWRPVRLECDLTMNRIMKDFEEFFVFFKWAIYQRNFIEDDIRLSVIIHQINGFE